jgi:4a-hydroxytetrahydrobiopterin dehydratase
MALADRRCGVCTASTPRATEEQVRAWSSELDPSWEVGARLVRRWRFRDFAQALAFANRVGAVAEVEGHHPEITVGWGSCRVEIWTHAIDGLSEADFVLAAKVDRL